MLQPHASFCNPSRPFQLHPPPTPKPPCFFSHPWQLGLEWPVSCLAGLEIKLCSFEGISGRAQFGCGLHGATFQRHTIDMRLEVGHWRDSAFPCKSLRHGACPRPPTPMAWVLCMMQCFPYTMLFLMTPIPSDWAVVYG